MHELNLEALRRARCRVAANYANADFFCAEVRERLCERLALLAIQPETIVELGAGACSATNMLRQHFPEALIVQSDVSLPMLQADSGTELNQLCADSQQLPVADASIDLVISNLMLPECPNPEHVFSEVRRVLRAPGVFLFSTLGPDSMKELRRAWAQVDRFSHVHEFADMHNVGDALVGAGFREPVMDVQMLTVTYENLDRMVDDLRSIAATNFSLQRNPGLTTPRRRTELLAALESSRNEDGRLPASLEIIFGQAWVGEPGVGVPMESGEARFPISRLK